MTDLIHAGVDLRIARTDLIAGPAADRSQCEHRRNTHQHKNDAPHSDPALVLFTSRNEW
jgi:hypothetical protein